MQDLLWIAIMAGLLAATLAYVRLCDNAWGARDDPRPLARRDHRARPARLPRGGARPPRTLL